jgi:hypothetical protein
VSDTITITQVETQYVRLDGNNFTIAKTRGQFYGGTLRRKTRRVRRVAIKKVGTEYVRLDGDNFTVTKTRKQFQCARIVKKTEWSEMVRKTVEMERKLLRLLNLREYGPLDVDVMNSRTSSPDIHFTNRDQINQRDSVTRGRFLQ